MHLLQEFAEQLVLKCLIFNCFDTKMMGTWFLGKKKKKKKSFFLQHILFIFCGPPFAEDPVALRGCLRAESGDFVDVSQEEFESVSELVRGRVKLSDVNAVSDKAWFELLETLHIVFLGGMEGGGGIATSGNTQNAFIWWITCNFDN